MATSPLRYFNSPNLKLLRFSLFIITATTTLTPEMADPLSTTASIAGIVSLASSVFHVVSKYVREAKGAKANVIALATETRNCHTGGYPHIGSALPRTC